jgi:hypothetical protein
MAFCGIAVQELGQRLDRAEGLHRPTSSEYSSKIAAFSSYKSLTEMARRE